METRITNSNTTSSTRRVASGHPQDHDAIEQMIADHREVQKLFKKFEKLDEQDEAAKQEIIEQTCMALTAHAQLEEELFYPAVKDEIKSPDLIDEAQVEHDVAKQLIARLQEGTMDTAERDATFKVLTEYVSHHVEEEETELFKQVRRAKVDTTLMAQGMADRKTELESELGIDHEAVAASVRSGRTQRSDSESSSQHKQEPAMAAKEAKESAAKPSRSHGESAPRGSKTKG